jgi:RNA ligase (TIGR02306 family)
MTEVYARKMASIQVVNGVYPIEGADKICQYGIQGWRVVDQVGKYNVGDLVVFAEVDSFIPSTVAPFLTKPGHYPKTYQGVEGEKLRTIRLRRALSQGLLLPLSVLAHVESELFEGLDVSFPLGIVKWEPPPEFTSADAKGNFPSFIIKTDQERCVSGDTLIDTDAGLKPIKEIVDEKLAVKVKSFNHETNQVEFKEVTDWSVMTRKKNTWLKITTKSGKEILVTKNHRVWVENLQCYRLAEDLFVGNCVKIVNKTDK